MAALSEPAPAAPAAPAAVLEARGITKLYGGLRAVDGVSFAVAPGEVLGIAGPNGAGKTTLFDTITGHTFASGGDILLAGAPIRGTKIHHRCRLGLARTFQHPVAADTLTVTFRSAMVQTVTPDEFRGRVSSVEYIIGTGGAPMVDGTPPGYALVTMTASGFQVTQMDAASNGAISQLTIPFAP